MSATDPPPPAYPTPGVPAVPTPAGPQRISAEVVRRLAVPIATIRPPLLAALRQLGFTIVTEQFSLIEAERGSRFGGLTLSGERIPIAIRVDLDPAGTGSLLTLRLEDRWGMPIGRNWGAVSVYRDAFSAAAETLDRAIAFVDPTSAAGFDPWRHDLGTGDVSSMQNAAGVAARAEEVVGRRTDRLLEGAKDGRDRSAAGAAGLSLATFVSDDRILELTADDLDGMLTTGQLVSGRPGALPGNLVADVQAFVIGLEEQLERAKSQQYGARSPLPVASAHMPVVTFLFQQSKLRERLPLRLLMVCTTCRLEKVVNPDLTRIRERSRRTKLLSGSVGAVFGTSSMSPYITLGRLVQMKKSEPDFVCPRCQGMDADETVVTFCPGCGDRRGETVLRTCPKCRHDFRPMAPAPPQWRELARPEPAPPAVPVLAATPVPPTPPPPVPPAVPAGWHPDPARRFEFRYWDGLAWSHHVSNAGVTKIDPLS